MDWKHRITQWDEWVAQLQESVFPLFPESTQFEKLNKWRASLHSDIFTIVVVGEFKRGKSTFVNALLGESLLPVDVTPTTATLNAMFYDRQRSLEIYFSDGRVDQLPLNREELERFKADQDHNFEEIRYLKLGLPAQLLDNRVILVDTPGVSDLNRQRVDVTYKFIPQADAVIFLLDLTSPLKRTELEFLTDVLDEEGVRKALFVGNFADQIDDEDLTEVLQETQNRLIKHLGHPVTVYPVSASMALQAKLDADQSLIAASFILPLEERLQEMIQKGMQIEAKLKRYVFRLINILTDLRKEIKDTQRMNSLSLDELESQIKQLELAIAEKDERRNQLEQYVSDREVEIKLMAAKSLHFLSEEIIEQLSDQIRIYKGQDIKDYIEQQLPILVRRLLKRWVDERGQQLQILFHQLAQRLSQALSQELASHVLISSVSQFSLNSNLQSLELTAKDISNTGLVAGLLAGGASTLAMAFGAPLFLPLVGLVGFPFIQKALLERNLESVKMMVQAELGVAVRQVVSSFAKEVDQYIHDNVKAILKQSLYKFDEYLSFLHSRTLSEIGSHTQGIDQVKEKSLGLHNALLLLDGYLKRLSNGDERPQPVLE